MFKSALVIIAFFIGFCAKPQNAIAQDIDIILNRLVLQNLEIGRGEIPIAYIQDGENKYAIIRLGARVFFIDKFGRDNKRISRSRALPLNYCAPINDFSRETDPKLNLRQDGLLEIKSANIINQASCNFILSGTSEIISFKHGEENQAIIWAETKLGQAADLHRISLSKTSRENTASAIIYAQKYSQNDFNRIINTLRARRGNRELLIAELKSSLGYFDWRDENISVQNLNDAGYYLSQSNDCLDLIDASAMLDTVLSRDPNRHVVHLNIADLGNKMRVAKCATGAINPLLVQEHYRQYCSAVGPNNITPRTRRKIIAALGLNNLNSKNCHPKYAAFRAIDNKDSAALIAALNDISINIDDFGYEGNNILGYALEKKNTEFIKLIIEKGANPDISSKYNYDDCCFAPTPLAKAIYNLDIETVKLLLSKQIPQSLRSLRYSPLPLAASIWTNNNAQEVAKLEIMKALLNSNYNLANTKNDNSENAFYTAANARSNNQIMQTIYDAGININTPNKYGRNALFAIPPFEKDKSLTSLEFLLLHGANPNQQNQENQTPIVHVFNYTGANEATLVAMISAFLRAGANPNLADNEGATALSKAAWRGLPDAVDELIKYGAKLPVKKQFERDTLQFVDERIAGLENDIKANPNANYYCNDTTAIICLERYKRVREALIKIN